ncbi:MAG: hypothetical protein ACREDH_15670 [Methylocella sp.]
MTQTPQPRRPVARFEVSENDDAVPRRPAETQREKFIHLVALRSGNLVKEVNHFCKLANKDTYPYGQGDAEAIGEFSRSLLNRIEQSFQVGREVAGGLVLPVEWEGQDIRRG